MSNIDDLQSVSYCSESSDSSSPANSQINYGRRYYSKNFIYRWIKIPPKSWHQSNIEKERKNNEQITESFWKFVGIKMSPGWKHLGYINHNISKNCLLFTRSSDNQKQVSLDPFLELNLNKSKTTPIKNCFQLSKYSDSDKINFPKSSIIWANVNNSIPLNYRKYLVNFIIRVSNYLEMNIHYLSMSIELLDQCLSSIKLQIKENPDLVGFAILHLAGKYYNNTNHIDYYLSSFLEYYNLEKKNERKSDFQNQIITLENQILKTLNYQLFFPSSLLTNDPRLNLKDPLIIYLISVFYYDPLLIHHFKIENLTNAIYKIFESFNKFPDEAPNKFLSLELEENINKQISLSIFCHLDDDKSELNFLFSQLNSDFQNTIFKMIADSKINTNSRKSFFPKTIITSEPQIDMISSNDSDNDEILLSNPLKKIWKGHLSTVYKSVTSSHVIKKVEIGDEGIDGTNLREISILKTLSHPNIVKLIKVINNSNKLSMLFPKYHTNLHHYIKTEKSLGLIQIKKISYDIIRAIDYCHQKNIIHLDLKPSNILLNENQEAILCDFGISTYFQDNRPESYQKEVITIPYRSPEIILGERYYGFAPDMWSIGCIIFEMFSGHYLFDSENEIDHLFQIYSKIGISEGVYFQNLPYFFPIKLQQNNYLKTNLPNIDSIGLDLLVKLLNPDPIERITSGNTINHPWFHDLK